MFNRVAVARISWDKVMVKLNHQLNYSVGVTKIWTYKHSFSVC